MRKNKVVKAFIRPKNLKQRFMEGKVSDLQEAFNDEVDAWHNSVEIVYPSLMEFLGMSVKEYTLFLKDPEELELQWLDERERAK